METRICVVFAFVAIVFLGALAVNVDARPVAAREGGGGHWGNRVDPPFHNLRGNYSGYGTFYGPTLPKDDNEFYSNIYFDDAHGRMRMEGPADRFFEYFLFSDYSYVYSEGDAGFLFFKPASPYFVSQAIDGHKKCVKIRWTYQEQVEGYSQLALMGYDEIEGRQLLTYNGPVIDVGSEGDVMGVTLHVQRGKGYIRVYDFWQLIPNDNPFMTGYGRITYHRITPGIPPASVFAMPRLCNSLL